MRTTLATIVTIGILTLAATSSAQTARDPLPLVGRVDVGISLAAFLIVGDDAIASAATIGPRITIHLSRRDAVQVTADTRIRNSHGFLQIGGPYTVAYQRTFIDRIDKRVFLLLGLAGGVEFAHNAESSYTNAGYLVTESGGTTRQVEAQTYNIPAYTRFELSPPFIPIAGIGVERRIAGRLMVQAEATLGTFFVISGARISANLIVPIGSIER